MREKSLSGSIIILAILAVSCATPVAPSGGEPDRTGPVVRFTYPESGATDFTDRSIRFEFDDFVDRGSFRTALRMEPDLNIPLEISWRRKTATVTLSRPLPDSTTVIFSLSTQLRDTRSNRLANPITLALSSGPEIDRGEIRVRLSKLLPSDDLEGVSAFLYREPADFSQAARYTASADTSGTITFRYLSPGDYRAIVVFDLNRNRTWDSTREHAQTFPDSVYTVTAGEPVDAGTVWYARDDTTRPVLQTPGFLSSNRLRFRFSREIRWEPDLNIQLISADSAQFISARYLFSDSQDRQVAFFHTEEPTSEGDMYGLELSMLQDVHGNRVLPFTTLIEGSSARDTTTIRYLGLATPQALRQEDPLILRYSGVLDQSQVVDSLLIYVNRELAVDKFNMELSANLLRIKPREGWRETETYEIRTWNPATARHVNVQPNLLKPSDIGGIELQLSDSLSFTHPTYVQVFDTRRNRVYAGFLDSKLEINNLPAGTYHVLAYPDVLGNQRWFSGQINPFRPPAPVYVNPNVQVRSRMTGTLQLEFE